MECITVRKMEHHQMKTNLFLSILSIFFFLFFLCTPNVHRVRGHLLSYTVLVTVKVKDKECENPSKIFKENT